MKGSAYMLFFVGILFEEEDSEIMSKIDEYYSLFDRQGFDVKLMLMKTSWQKDNEFNFSGGPDEISWALNSIHACANNDHLILIDTRLKLNISELLTAIRQLPNYTIGEGFILGSRQDFEIIQ